MNSASEKLFLESIKLMETVISSLVRPWTLLNNMHFDSNRVLDITSKMKKSVPIIHIISAVGVGGLTKSV